LRLPLPGSRILAPGVALELLVPVRPESKFKFCVFCCVDDPPLYFLINSEINPYIKDRNHLLEQQVLIPKAELDGRIYKDSYLDCSQAFENFTHTEVCALIEANRGCYMGRLSDGVLAQVVEVVKGSVTLRPLEIVAIMSALCPPK
jgi:hypothetical protein